MNTVLDILAITVPSILTIITIWIYLYQIYHEEWTLVHKLKNVDIVLVINPSMLSYICEHGKSIEESVKSALDLNIEPLYDMRAGIGNLQNVYYKTTVNEYFDSSVSAGS